MACCCRVLLVVLFFSLLPVFKCDSTIHSSYRKDFFLPYDQYPEANLPDPVHGGRFHLVAIAAANGSAGQITLNGQAVTFDSGQDPDKWFVDWMHIYPLTMTTGEPVWISFHTRDSSFDKASTGSLKITTTSGKTAISGNFPIQLAMCNITYVTTDSSYFKLLIHVHNGDHDTRTIKTVFINGTDMTSSVSNKQSLTVTSGSSTLLVIPLPKAQLPGNLFTVVLQYAEAGTPESAAGGRLLRTHFPIEAWPKSEECPFPTVNDDNYKFHRDHGIDTLFFGEKSAKSCGKDTAGHDIAGKLAIQYDFYCLVQTDVPLVKLENNSHVLAQLISDEGDSKLDDGLRKLMKTTELTWSQDGTMSTYCGGSRNRRNGIFAGVADIQGMDMYVAACAPHIQLFGHPPPLRGSYDYLRLTRNNHMPLPTWTYSQLLDDGWDAKIGSRVIAYRQPNKYEARIQAMSVIAGCAKGLMYFQSDIAEKDHYGDTWKEIANFNKDIGAVREYLREGDCTDMFSTSDGTGFHMQSITQTIRSQTAIIVPVINIKNEGGISDIECGIGQNLHWKLNSHTVDKITVTIPSDFGSVVDKFEVQNGKILNVNAEFEQVVLGKDLYGEAVLGTTVQLSSIHMTTDLSTRLFVLANTPDVRSDIQKRL